MRTIIVIPLVFSASVASAFADTKAPGTQPGAQGGRNVTVTVRPVNADALAAPGDLRQQIEKAGGELGKLADALAAAQRDVADCYAAATPQGGAAAGSYTACLAGAAGASRAAWLGVAQTFTRFADDLGPVGKRIEEVKASLADSVRKNTAEASTLKAGLATSRDKAALALAAIRRGAPVTPGQENAIRLLVDDMITAQRKVDIRTRNARIAETAMARLAGYAGQIGQARDGAAVVAHMADNRADLWADTLSGLHDDALGRAMTEGLDDKTIQQLSPVMERLAGLGLEHFDLPPLPPGADDPKAAEVPAILPRGGSLEDLLRKALDGSGDDAVAGK